MLRRTLLPATAILAVTIPGVSQAAITINVNPVGGNVVATFGGSLNTAGLTSVGTGTYYAAGISPNVGEISFVNSAPTLAGYSGFTGPTNYGSVFGSGGMTNATSTTGNNFVFYATQGSASGGGFTPYVSLPIGYVSNSALSGSETFANQTFASLGLTPGTYVYTSAHDTITVIVGQAIGGVPEPATWAMMLLGFGAIGWTMRRRKAPIPQLA